MPRSAQRTALQKSFGLVASFHKNSTPIEEIQGTERILDTHYQENADVPPCYLPGLCAACNNTESDALTNGI